MARAILLAAAIALIAAGAAGLAVGSIGVDWLSSLLPPLAIDDDALRRTVLALGVATVVIGAGHAAVAFGIGQGSGWAASAGILLGGLGAVAWLGLAASALTAGAAGSLDGAVAIGGGMAALLAAAAYAAVAAALVHRRRTGGGT